LSTHNDVGLAWLADALRQLRQQGRTKAVGYLEAVLEEVVFETKMSFKSESTARKASRS
jgi:ABC-type molybdate transport system ATPase subunit